MRITEAGPTGKGVKTNKHDSYDTLRECEKVVGCPAKLSGRRNKPAISRRHFGEEEKQ
jgi:hypothetical protein